MNKLICFYDANGQALAFRYKSGVNADFDYYYYAYNSRGDIVGLYSYDGSVYCTYSYDAWGNILHVKNVYGNEITSSTNIAILQSLKYRGYVYDYEKGFYYLQSRKPKLSLQSSPVLLELYEATQMATGQLITAMQ